MPRGAGKPCLGCGATIPNRSKQCPDCGAEQRPRNHSSPQKGTGLPPLTDQEFDFDSIDNETGACLWINHPGLAPALSLVQACGGSFKEAYAALNQIALMTWATDAQDDETPSTEEDE